MASLTFACIADKRYKNAFRALADEKGTPMAVLVREALDARYGGELERYLSFFAPDGKLKHQLEHEHASGE